MSLFFRKSSLRRATTNLKSQLDTFRGFTNEPLYPQSACEKATYCSKTIAALENSISLIQSAKNELVILIDSVEQDYAEIKKPEKSSFLEEFQQVASETRYEETLTEAEAMLCALKTRLAEVRHEHALAKKDIQKDIGKQFDEIDEKCFKDQESQHKLNVGDKGISADIADTSQHAMECSDHQDTVATVCPPLRDIDSISESLQNTRTSIKPPQVSVPRFSGNAEDFQEYWAIFQAVVHENSSLTKMEKMILLKESLVGRAATTIRGIKMMPKNYEWMIETLKKKYDNVTTARANIIHRLSNLQHTKDNTGETIFDELRSLVNEMVSSGYNVVVTRDPMWTEAILQKLPKHIVEEFLRENKDGESFTIGETLDRLETVITRYKYVNQRMRSQESSLSPTHPPQQTSAFPGRSKVCYFCGRNNHRTFQCRTVYEPSERRKMAMEQNLCWKCFSKDHRSSECSRPNCSICAKLHDTTLCLRKSSETMMHRPTNERQQPIKPTTKTRVNTNASSAHQYDTTQGTRQHVPFTLASFKPALLPPALSVAMLTCLGLITGGYSCQEGYMRHSAELKCTQRHECHYEFRHELMFNRVTQHLCILLRHENSTVGYKKIRRTSVRFECQKESLFWTRETKHAIRSVTRCRGLGSCIDTTCETLNPDQIVPELNDSVPSPGYTACSIQCSGIDCICPFPIRACTFYSVRHVPVSQSSFEIFRCSGWQPLVTFEISLQAYKMRKQQKIALLPYSSKQLGNFNLLLNSVGSTQFSHSQKFALSQKDTFAIPDSFVFPIQCDSKQKAERNFSYCRNMHFCDCDVSGVTPNCRCPHNELSALRRNPQYRLPVSTPYASILREANTIIAETDQRETTVVITSKQRFEGAHLNIDTPCTIQAGILEGCYSCHQGSQISIACYSSIPSWTTIVCAHHIFSIECSPANRTSTIKITFDRAVVSSHCYTICGGNNVTQSGPAECRVSDAHLGSAPPGLQHAAHVSRFIARL
ncbi:zinc knuckle [Ostertagia ostertagi]